MLCDFVQVGAHKLGLRKYGKTALTLNSCCRDKGLTILDEAQVEAIVAAIEEEKAESEKTKGKGGQQAKKKVEETPDTPPEIQ